MTDEEKAEEYKKQFYGVRSLFGFSDIEQAYLAGLHEGQPKWHDLRENPTDIPPRKDDIYSVEVWAKDARGNYGTAVFSYACFKDDGKYNHWSGVVPVLWTELPTFDKE